MPALPTSTVKNILNSAKKVAGGTLKQKLGETAIKEGAQLVENAGNTALVAGSGTQTYSAQDANAAMLAAAREATAANMAEAQRNRDFQREIYNESSAFNAEQARLAQEFNAQQAQLTRDWQERMSNTSYQRAVADMRKAGLNPILAYGQGGASTPYSSSASSSGAASIGTLSGATGSAHSYSALMDHSDVQLAGMAAESIENLANQASGWVTNLTEWFSKESREARKENRQEKRAEKNSGKKKKIKEEPDFSSSSKRANPTDLSH